MPAWARPRPGLLTTEGDSAVVVGPEGRLCGRERPVRLGPALGGLGAGQLVGLCSAHTDGSRAGRGQQQVLKLAQLEAHTGHKVKGSEN